MAEDGKHHSHTKHILALHYAAHCTFELNKKFSACTVDWARQPALHEVGTRIVYLILAESTFF